MSSSSTSRLSMLDDLVSSPNTAPEGASRETGTHGSPSLPRLNSALPPLGMDARSMPILAPKPVRPSRLPRSLDTWQRLQLITYIDVQPSASLLTAAPGDAAGANVEPLFTLSVYFHHSPNRIPSNTTAARDRRLSTERPCPSTRPDVVISRSFAEYERLRHRLWTIIDSRHPVYCPLCDWFVLLMHTTLSQPALLTSTIYRSPTARAKKMRKFLCRVINELHENKASCPAVCEAQHELPFLIHVFLFGEETTASSVESAIAMAA